MIASPLLMGLVLLIDPSSSHVEWSGGVAVELRGGYAPPSPGVSESVPAMRLSIAPTAVMLYQSRVRNREIWLEYTPQAYLRLSSVYSQRYPLTFHQLRARFSGDFSRRLSWLGVLGGSVGQADYTLQASQLGTDPSTGADGSNDAPIDGGSQGPLIEEQIVTTAGVSGAAGLIARPSSVHSITVLPSFTVRRLLSTPPSAGVGISYDQSSGDVSISHRYVASPKDSLSSTATGGYVDFEEDTNGVQRGSQVYAAASVAWQRRLRRRLDNQITGGVFFTRQVIASDVLGLSNQGLPAFPTFDYSLFGRLFERSKLRISANVNTGIRAYFDAVQGDVRPLAGGGVGLDFFHPPDLTVGLAASFYTPPFAPTQIERDNPANGRTSLSVRTPVTYRITRNYSMEFGTIFTGRGPHLALIDGGDPFTQTEFWVYVSFQAFYTQ